MIRCHLKGSLGDSLHAVLCAAGYNIRWLLRMIVKKGISFFCACFCPPVWGRWAIDSGNFL
jgi:IS5 family transposase